MNPRTLSDGGRSYAPAAGALAAGEKFGEEIDRIAPGGGRAEIHALIAAARLDRARVQPQIS